MTWRIREVPNKYANCVKDGHEKQKHEDQSQKEKIKFKKNKK